MKQKQAKSGKPPGSDKYRQESAEAKPSQKLWQEGEQPKRPPPATSGQLGPKSKPKTKEEKRAMKEALHMDLSKRRTEKTGRKLESARVKLAEQKPQKPDGSAKKISHAAGYEVWAKVHRKIHEVERDNVGVEAAHHAELVGEQAGRTIVRLAKQRSRTRPTRQVRKWEKKDIRANADYRLRQMAQEHPELNRNVLKRHFQKKRIQKQFRKEVNEVAAKVTKKAGQTTISAMEKVSRAALDFVRQNPKVIAVALFGLLLIVILQSCIGGALIVGGGLTGAIGGTSFLAEDVEIDEAELRYTEWEVDLYLQAQNARSSHPGNNEYRFSLADVGHDPYALLAYLTATHDDFTYTEIESELRSIFNQQYTLTITRITERRSYTVRVSTPGGGSTTRTVYYNYYILQTTLTARPFESIISPLLSTQDERDRYDIYMLLHGNRQYIGNPFDFQWLPYVSCYYGYRVHPISGVKDYHSGVDIAVPTGTAIKAGRSGVVLEAGNNGGFGLTMLIDYGGGVSARYAHCSSLHVSAGQTVCTGDIIALSGNTGTSTGPHLHMEVIKEGRYLNPLYFVDGTI